MSKNPILHSWTDYTVPVLAPWFTLFQDIEEQSTHSVLTCHWQRIDPSNKMKQTAGSQLTRSCCMAAVT